MKKNRENIPSILQLKLKDTPKKTIQKYWLSIISDGMGASIKIPVIVARGKKDKPVLGVTAAIHGNEINGISVIHRLFDEINVEELEGSIIAIPVANVPSFIAGERRFTDGVDLNHVMPGREDGNASQVYAYRLFHRVIKHFDYLLDLHTASFGRVNSYYVRADMDDPRTREMALLQNAEIIVHNPPSDGTLRGAAEELGIPAITLEIGNPNTFQKKMIKSGVEGVHNVLSSLKMISDEIAAPDEETVLCKKSYWIYTNIGGLLTVHVDLKDKVKKGKKLATIKDVFGNKIKDFKAPEDGIVIGKSVSPMNQSGGRILHLGIC